MNMEMPREQAVIQEALMNMKMPSQQEVIQEALEILEKPQVAIEDCSFGFYVAGG